MSEVPPLFQEAARCDVCNCSFNTFRRRHHCRCCGRTLCNEHSSYQMPLPQFGLSSSVRVCFECFNNSTRSEKNDSQGSSDAVTTTDKFSGLSVGEDVISEFKSTPEHPSLTAVECKCGMPLCICEAPIPDPVALPIQTGAIPSSQSNTRPKKASSSQQTASALKRPASSSVNKPSSIFNPGQASNGSSDEASAEYDVNGEGLRDAIKNSNATAVKKLLSEGVDPNYCDKQGLTLLHLAALFNQTDIAFILMDHGANVESKNAQGETPLDCAPTMLQYKMRTKIDEIKGAE